MKKYELFMGLREKNGDEVSDMAFEEFISDYVVPRFPDGFSVIDVIGRWKNADGHIITEDSKCLIIVLDIFEVNDRTENMIKQLQELYKIQYNQESVMLLISDVDVTF